MIGESDLQVPYVNQDVDHDCSIGTIKLNATFCRGYEVDAVKVHCGLYSTLKTCLSFSPSLRRLCCSIRIVCWTKGD